MVLLCQDRRLLWKVKQNIMLMEMWRVLYTILGIKNLIKYFMMRRENSKVILCYMIMAFGTLQNLSSKLSFQSPFKGPSGICLQWMYSEGLFAALLKSFEAHFGVLVKSFLEYILKHIWEQKSRRKIIKNIWKNFEIFLDILEQLCVCAKVCDECGLKSLSPDYILKSLKCFEYLEILWNL